MTRQDGRAFDELRPIKITPDFVKFAEGSCLIQCGNTMVLCCASVEDRVPPHVPEGTGWVTAEYSMLPRANRERSKRDIAKLKLSPRSAEIQRLVGRSLRAAVDLAKLGEHTITIDCDVLQGDGGTRTASVTGGFVALALACRKLVEEGYLGSTPIRHFVTGLVGAEHVLQAYVPAVHGKEARKQAPGKEGLLGVEGIADDLILQGLQTALDSAPAPQTTAQDTDRTAITYTDLYEWGISGTANSADRRRALLARLGLPPRLSKKELLQVLNTLYTWESLDAQIKMME